MGRCSGEDVISGELSMGAATAVVVWSSFASMAAQGLALSRPVGLGVDLGTSGVRVCFVERVSAEEVAIVGEEAVRWSDAEGGKAEVWCGALRETLGRCDPGVVSRVARVAVSGTSASALVVDGATGAVSRAPRMYDYAVGGDSGARAVAAIAGHAPAGHTCRARTSSLAKLVAWQCERPLGETEVVAHQADYVAAALAAGLDGGGRLPPGTPLYSDWHNALKLGFDVEALEWPEWITSGTLPSVGAPPSALAGLAVLRPGFGPAAEEEGGGGRVVTKSGATYWGLPAGAEVVGGTTDSIAACLARAGHG